MTAPFCAAVVEIVGAAGAISLPPPSNIVPPPPPHPHIKALARKTAVAIAACASMVRLRTRADKLFRSFLFNRRPIERSTRSTINAVNLRIRSGARLCEL
jgi:hypothetical protein